MLERDDIKNLFALMQGHYLHRWASALADPEVMKIAISEWHRVLIGFMPEDILRGVCRLPVDWPPTLGQFSRLCLPPLNRLILGFDDRFEERAHKYKFTADSASEEAHRARLQAAADKDLTNEMTVEALQMIQADGIEHVMALASSNKPALEKPKHKFAV
jgi:hypothetical protein